MPTVPPNIPLDTSVASACFCPRPAVLILEAIKCSMISLAGESRGLIRSRNPLPPTNSVNVNTVAAQNLLWHVVLLSEASNSSSNS